MAVMEVELPSGYVADVEALPSITRAKEIKRIDTANGDTNVVIYFDRVSLIYSIYQLCIFKYLIICRLQEKNCVLQFLHIELIKLRITNPFP
jgi:hypothetical protein